MIRLKVDENFHNDVVSALQARGHDALSVRDQQMRGVEDVRLGEVRRAEGRVLITFDLDFSDIRKFPPQEHPRLIVFRLADQSRPYVLRVFQKVLDLLDNEPVEGSLWIVEEHRVRVRRGDGNGKS
jgi:predicted nuclease of predicted toxin-antitoxin system